MYYLCSITRKMEKQQTEGRMNIWALLKNILPFVLPYRGLIMVTLVLMFAANVYVGLVALCIVPVYFEKRNS